MFNKNEKNKKTQDDVLKKGLSILKTEYFLKEVLLATNRLNEKINSMLLTDNFMPSNPVDIKILANDLNLVKNITETLYETNVTNVYSNNYKQNLSVKIKILSAKKDIEDLKEFILNRVASRYIVLITDTYDTSVESVEIKIYEKASDTQNNLLGIVKYFFLLDKVTLRTKSNTREIDFEDLNTEENLNQQLFRIIKTELNLQISK